VSDLMQASLACITCMVWMYLGDPPVTEMQSRSILVYTRAIWLFVSVRGSQSYGRCGKIEKLQVERRMGEHAATVVHLRMKTPTVFAEVMDTL
jgi:hypothetical protein